MEQLIFLAAAAVCVIFALVVVFHPDPIRSVMALVACFCALAVIYVQLAAPFVAALQLIVYAGAILVLFLFVIMLLNVERLRDDGERSVPRMILSVISAGGLGGMIAARAITSQPPTASGGVAVEDLGTVHELALRLFNHHLLAFEVVSVVLLAALVGSMFLSAPEKKEKA